jgi:hypothetical protein
MAQEFLDTYLNDHHAGSQMAVEVLALLRKIDESTIWQELEAEIQVDRLELERVMRSVDVDLSALRRATAWTAEKIVELKMHIDDRSEASLLRKLELIEALALGIDGKRALWAALEAVSERTSGLKDLDYSRLLARAKAQRDVVEARRLNAAIEALTARLPA